MKVKKILKQKKGITLISLVITIIILLILAGISLRTLSENNGIMNNAENAKEKSEISKEKEILEISVAQAMGKNRYGSLIKNELKTYLNSNAGERETDVKEDEDYFLVQFLDSKRNYNVEKNGEISKLETEVAFDKSPGKFNESQDGSTLAGTEEQPYEISSIEDLCSFSNFIATGSWRWSPRIYVILTKDLNFKSDLSYVDGYLSYDGAIPSCESAEELKRVLNEDHGFLAIGRDYGFDGIFDGCYKEIKNISGDSLFTSSKGSIIKNVTLSGEIDAKGEKKSGFCNSTGNSGIKIMNCINKVNIINTSGGKVGGFVGSPYSAATLINCINKGTISGTSGIAGLLGWDWSKQSKIYNCINIADNTAAIINTTYADTSTKLINILNYGKCQFFSAKCPTIVNAFSMKGCLTTTPNAPVVEYEEEYIKSNAFIGQMNSFIEEGKIVTTVDDTTTEEDIDTTGWAKWILGEDGYPTLDFKTTWNGESWITE